MGVREDGRFTVGEGASHSLPLPPLQEEHNPSFPAADFFSGIRDPAPLLPLGLFPGKDR